MSYIEDNMMIGEEIMYRAYIHRITYAIPLFSAVIPHRF